MKTDKLEKLLLLEQTGEVSPRQRRQLAACSEAPAKRSELSALCSSVPVVDGEPSAWTVAKINARLRGERRTVLNFSNVWKTALALAACLMAVTGILNFHGGKQTSSTAVVAVVAAPAEDVWSDPLEEDLSSLENLIVAISGDPFEIMEM